MVIFVQDSTPAHVGVVILRYAIFIILFFQICSDSSAEGGPAQPHECHYEHHRPRHTPQQSFQGLQSKVP